MLQSVLYFPITYFILVHCILFLPSGFAVNIATTSRIGGNETDRLSLLGFKSKIINDPLRILSSWNTSVHFCQWAGVTCSIKHQRVAVLDLNSLKLEGPISSHIGNLSFLRELRLQNNSLSGVIPLEMGRLHRLELLFLDNNSFAGEIPANISACSNLYFISADYNKLVGKIPAELGLLSNLVYISFIWNKLTASIPHSFGNLSSLESLSLTGNNLTGPIPDSLCRLPHLNEIAIGGNYFSGTLPTSLFNHSSITAIDVGQNLITGSIPSDFGITLPNLQFLSIAINKFTGIFPISISNATNLAYFFANENEFVGSVPSLGRLNLLEQFQISQNRLGTGKAGDLSFLSTLNNSTNLVKLGISNNRFGGMLPESIANLSITLTQLFLDENRISGGFPRGIQNLVNLEALSAGFNLFTGNIPSEIGNLKNLLLLNLVRCDFSGIIPYSFGNLTFLLNLVLAENNLNGSIPSSLGGCKDMVILDLSENNLTGAIPDEVISLSSLSIAFNLSWNQLTGFLPIEVGRLKNLGLLDVSENELSGDIPATISSCLRLEILCLQGNFFRGNIPSSFRSLKGISYIDLSRNNLSGGVPEYFAEFTNLQQLNLSFNNFSGPIPREGFFANATATLIIGNNQLCGGIPDLKLPVCKVNGSKKKGLVLWLRLVISISSGILALALLLCFASIFWFRKTKKESSIVLPGNPLLQMSYQDLLKATDSFSPGNLIGAGSFGSVYKGILDDGSTIAVKVFNLVRHGASRSFIAECDALRNIRHRNLVKVLTACSSVDYQGNDFKALVYEFMVNGSLEDWLHPTLAGSSENVEHRKLSLLQRLSIAIDVASALNYVHHECEAAIVHCDLKPSNILLDDEFTAHVGDFGLAKFLPENPHEITSISQTGSIGVRGSIGYAAPEYGLGSEASTYGDVYSYGILILELFTGKRPTDDVFQDSLNLHNFVKMTMPGRMVEILDPETLQEIEDLEQASTNNASNQISPTNHSIQGCLNLIFEIGLACSKELATERMNIYNAAAELNSVRKILAEILESPGPPPRSAGAQEQ